MWTLGWKQKISNSLGGALYGNRSALSSCRTEFWGSQEEFEVEMMLQSLISTSLSCRQSLDTLVLLKAKLAESSTGWIDRFVTSQGVFVLHKLLEDTIAASSSEEVSIQSDRELSIVECFTLLYTRSTVAKQLFSEDPSQQIQKTLLRSLISPNERIRELASNVILAMKRAPGNPYKVLHTLTLSRH